MNDNIKTLLAQAHLEFHPDTNAIAARYAELIALDCISVIRAGMERSGRDTPQYKQSTKHIKMIERHFDLKTPSGEQTSASERVMESIIKDRTMNVELQGQEKEHMREILSNLVPYETTNNQRFFTEYFKYLGKEYSMTDFGDDDYEIIHHKKEDDLNEQHI